MYLDKLIGAELKGATVSICKKTEEGGQHVTVRCYGCGSLHHTKNIGYCNPETHIVSCYRSVFDSDPCQCLDPKAFPLVHVCGIDCGEHCEENDAIRNLYKKLEANNAERASLNAGFEIPVYSWNFMLQYAGELARAFLTNTATDEDKQRVKNWVKEDISKSAESK